MSRRLRHNLSLAAMILCVMAAFASCVNDDVEENTGIGPGDAVPAFSVTLDDGSVFSDASARGKVAVIEFFNTTCPDCRQSLPKLQQVYGSFEADPEVIIVAIAREEETDAIKAFWQENGLTVPYSPQPDRRVYNLFATVGIPRIFVVSPSGTVTAAYGPEDAPSPSRLESDITSALRLSGR